MRSPGAREQAVQAALVHAGRIDVLLNAVGVVAFGAVADLSNGALEELFATNAFVTITLARAALGSRP